MKRLALVLLLAGCGQDGTDVASVQDDLTVKAAAIPKGIPRCLPDRTYATPTWECATVNAMRLESIEVTNADGSKPWTQGPPRVAARVRNTTGAFLNYPGTRFDSTAGASVTEQRYGLFGCDVTEMAGAFATAPAKGTPVTFSAQPISLGSPCSAPTLSITVIAP